MTPQEFFKNDLFAENAGVVLLEVREGYSKAKLEIKPEHLNAGARTQGGAIFTLADLALPAVRKIPLLKTNAFSLSPPTSLFYGQADRAIHFMPKRTNAISDEVQAVTKST